MIAFFLDITILFDLVGDDLVGDDLVGKRAMIASMSDEAIVIVFFPDRSKKI
jgi:hypothetical protein